jgi:two-component system response regulator HydG
MSGDAILVLSDSLPQAADARFVYVRDREAAGEYLGSGRGRAVCLDRHDVVDLLADARWLRRRRNRLPVVAVVAADEVGRAADLMAAGVAEIVVRDGEPTASVLARLEALRRRADRPAASAGAAEHIVAKSPAMRVCLELVCKAQRSDATVLLQGETGTGKEVIARAIHAGSRRSARSFVALNCAAFPETLLESELFGYERGAFTGAERAKRGHFEAASGGTLFLDEIGETTPGFQVKLLRALQEGVVRPRGPETCASSRTRSRASSRAPRASQR